MHIIISIIIKLKGRHYLKTLTFKTNFNLVNNLKFHFTSEEYKYDCYGGGGNIFWIIQQVITCMNVMQNSKSTIELLQSFILVMESSIILKNKSRSIKTAEVDHTAREIISIYLGYLFLLKD